MIRRAITVVGEPGRSVSIGLHGLPHDQRMAQSNVARKDDDEPLEMKITAGKSITQAAVTVETDQGLRGRTGSDYVTLTRDGRAGCDSHNRTGSSIRIDRA